MSSRTIARKYGATQEQKLWDERMARLGKFCNLKAPRIILIHSCLLQLHHYGMREALWFWFQSHYWSSWKSSLWFFWQEKILRLTSDEIEKKIMEEE